jgi:hypothetical protein
VVSDTKLLGFLLWGLQGLCSVWSVTGLDVVGLEVVGTTVEGMGAREEGIKVVEPPSVVGNKVLGLTKRC